MTKFNRIFESGDCFTSLNKPLSCLSRFIFIPHKTLTKLWTLKRLHCADIAIVFQLGMPAIGANWVIKGWVMASCEIGRVTAATSPCCLIVNVLKLTEPVVPGRHSPKIKPSEPAVNVHCHSGRCTALWTSQTNELLSQIWVISLQHAQPCYDVM